MQPLLGSGGCGHCSTRCSKGEKGRGVWDGRLKAGGRCVKWEEEMEFAGKEEERV